ncbi:pyridoxal phosphate-dependent aminotransferase [Pseudomonas sp. LB3P38]|uniref:pyridoxal phosphate-dependent aminotransferase n=1 Tax=Pseudomonas lyxosi TaxID=3398358 RepID=UPI0039EEFFB4
MSFIAPRLNVIKPSASITVANRAAELRAAGQDVINLGTGEPDFATPDHVVEAAISAIRNGETRYTIVDGTKALKAAIIEKFRRDNQLTFSMDEITVGAGAKQIIYNAMLATLAPGDEVIVPAPYWVSYTDIVLLGEGVPVVLQCTQQDGFKLRPEVLEQAITPRTKWLMLNSPSNPTGAIYSHDELKALAEVLLRYPHVHVMSDDIYEHVLYEGASFSTIAAVEPRLKERTLTINGVSKAYAMTGWRIGFAGGSKELIKAISTVQGQSTSNPCSISQAASVAALLGPQDLLAERAAAFQHRRDRCIELIRDIPGLSCEVPPGAFYLYINCAGVIGKSRLDGRAIASDEDFTMYLLDDAKVAVVQGAAYGLSPYIRISIATSLETLECAFARIAAAVANLS